MKIFRRRRVNRSAESAAAAIYVARLEVRLAASSAESAILAVDRALAVFEAEDPADFELVEVMAYVTATYKAAERAVALASASDRAAAELAIACVEARIALADYEDVVVGTAELAHERGELARDLLGFATGVAQLMGMIDAAAAEDADEFVDEFARLAGELSPQGART